MAKSVLVISDERHIARLVQVNLERQGFDVRVAADLGEARQKIDQLAPYGIVVDSSRHTGWDEFAAGLAQDPETRDIGLMDLRYPGAWRRW